MDTLLSSSITTLLILTGVMLLGITFILGLYVLASIVYERAIRRK